MMGPAACGWEFPGDNPPMREFSGKEQLYLYSQWAEEDKQAAKGGSSNRPENRESRPTKQPTCYPGAIEAAET